MRRSKSNPAKYARNYKKISQRKMTENDMDFEKEEIERLRNLLKTSTEHLSQHAPKNDEQKKRKRNQKQDDGDDDNNKATNKQSNEIKMDYDEKESDIEYITDGTALILPSRKKKAPKKKTYELTPEELKAAKAKHKALQRKLAQIEQRHDRKKRRTELYATLSEHALSETEMKLMTRSADMGKKVSKKQALTKILQKERVGIQLTQEEKDMLYTNTERDESAYEEQFGTNSTTVADETMSKSETNDINEDQVVPLAFSSSGKKKKKNKIKKKNQTRTSGTPSNDEEQSKGDNDQDAETTSVTTPEDIEEEKLQVAEEEETKTNLSFAAQMMAGLSSLKTSAADQKIELDKKRAKEQAELEEKRLQEEEEERKKRKSYVPQNPAILKSAAVMGLKPSEKDVGKDGWRVLPVERPDEVNDSRYNLPVSTMEYEIVDSIRNNSVTIICSETGSGKSTQVPQFLYESGMTLGNARAKGEDDGLLICVTQPRRVAAVSTAKRVCYEMGHSNDKGQSIQGKKGVGNTVAYQTKYETAGLGPKTRIKFMTDGILLQEIKSDLLLRKYAGKFLHQMIEQFMVQGRHKFTLYILYR